MTGVVLFAGGGLACHGLKEAGIDLQLGVEWDADAVTVAQATGLEHVIEVDVRDPELRQRVERPGLLWSSFPCQAWSAAGKRLGAQDERNGWPWTVDWIDAVSPRWFIAENVRGLTFHRGEADCDAGARPKPDDCPRCYLDHVILPQLRERFTWVDCRVLNSADFGTAQHRRRLFIVAGPCRISWPAPTHSEGGDLWTQPWRSMGEALGLSLMDAEGRRGAVNRKGSPLRTVGTKGNQTVQHVIGGGRNPECKANAHLRSYRLLTDEPCVTLAAKQRGQGSWIESRWPGPSPTVSTVEAKGSNDAYRSADQKPKINKACDALWVATGRRRLTVEECRVLMNAPTCYDDALDLVTKTAAYRILGNGVDRQLSRLLALAVLDADKENP